MKKFIYISGIVCANLMLVGALLKSLHLAGASILLLLSILLFCIGFLPFALISSYRDQEEKKYKWLYIVTYFVFSFVLLGALFKILHWPYASIMMIIGIPLPFVLFLPVYLYHTRKTKNVSVLNNLAVMFGMTFLAVFSVLLSINVSAFVLNNLAVNSFNKEQVTRFYSTNTRYYQAKDIVIQKADDLCSYIDVLKCEILVATKNSLCENGKPGEDFSPLNIINKGDVNSSIFLDPDNKSESKLETLRNMIEEFNALVASSSKPSNELKALSGSRFGVDEKNYQDQKSNDLRYLNWKDREFPSNQLIVVLDVLSRIQCNVRFVENEYLQKL